MNDFLTNNSYIWLVARSLVSRMGYADMADFLRSNYYFKANLTRGSVEEAAGGGAEYQMPQAYAAFIPVLARRILPGGEMDRLIRDLDRNVLLSRLSEGRSFFSREYVCYAPDRRSRRIALYVQLYLTGQDVSVSALTVDLSELYERSSVSLTRGDFDTLTGFFARAGGYRISAEQLRLRAGDVAAVIIADVRGFRALCEEYGQRAGELVAADAARRLAERFPAGTILTRSDVDEFTALLCGTDPQQAQDAMQSVLSSGLFIQDGEKTIPYRLSLGCAMFPEDSRDFTQLCTMAGAARKYTRNNLASPFCLFRPYMLQKVSSSAGFNPMDVVENIPGAILVYRAEGDEEIIYANRETWHLFECESFEEFMEQVGGTWRGFVYGEDYGRVSREIRSQQDVDGNDSATDYLRFRVLTKSGALRELEDVGRLVESPYYGKVFYVFLHDAGQKADILQKAMMRP